MRTNDVMIDSLNDFEVCPKCGSDNVSVHNTDEIEFDYRGKGFYRFDCFCGDCKHEFRAMMYFKFEPISYDDWRK